MDQVDLTNRQLGEFRLLRRVGRGGMAEVYLAEQLSLNRRVAVKVLRSELVVDEVHRKRFEQEARAAAGLNHSNIVQVYLIGEENGVHYIAQEYVDGVNLREFLRRKGPLETEVALHVMRQVAAALAAANDAGIVHRDIKPENIMVTRKGEAKITDFGLAQLTQLGDGSNLTQVGITMGTPTYMSPEQVNGEKLDQRSDIYSFGITCYHMLCGKPPFQAETALAIAVKHLNESPLPLSQVRPDIPAAICQIVHKMIARDKKERYQNAVELLNDLKRVTKALKEEPDAVSLAHFEPTQSRVPFSERFHDWSGRKQLQIFLVSILVVSALATAAGWVLRTPDPRQTPPRKPTIRRLSSAQEQYLAAVLVGEDEEAWQAVHKYHDDDNFTRLAEVQLARIYLQSDRLDEAEAIYKKLASLPVDERELKATGFAGQAIVESLRGKYSESNRTIGVYVREHRDYLSPEMRQLVFEALQVNNRHVQQQTNRDLLELFRDEDDDVPEAAD